MAKKLPRKLGLPNVEVILLGKPGIQAVKEIPNTCSRPIKETNAVDIITAFTRQETLLKSVTRLTIKTYNRKKKMILRNPGKEAYLYRLKSRDRSAYPQKIRIGYLNGNLICHFLNKIRRGLKRRNKQKIKV